ncbi:MAG: hypothetical protein L3K17_05815 [Thermoplasmata archaeon]|nr:hypothetical protein [Thermoplasmata archaeon]
MSGPHISPSQCVLLLQALVARELVEGMGLSGNRTAALLGVAPSAVSQYLHGKRRTGPLDGLGARADVQALARSVAQSLATDTSERGPAVRPLLEAAATLYEEVEGKPAAPEPERIPRRRELARQLRERVAAEQTAVTDCMHLAQKSRDELTRAVFRQLAADSLRHAEIAASLASYLDRGIDRTWASGITPADVQRLIQREHDAEQESGEHLEGAVGGVMALLAASMEADERKHTELLERMLKTAFLEGKGAVSRRLTTRPPPSGRRVVAPGR